jgi:hypothetical protein
MKTKWEYIFLLRNYGVDVKGRHSGFRGVIPAILSKSAFLFKDDKQVTDSLDKSLGPGSMGLDCSLGNPPFSFQQVKL